MNGFDACAILHEDPAASRIPMMMVTGSMSGPGDAGVPHVRQVLGKPSTAQELRTRVQLKGAVTERLRAGRPRSARTQATRERLKARTVSVGRQCVAPGTPMAGDC